MKYKIGDKVLLCSREQAIAMEYKEKIGIESPMFSKFGSIVTIERIEHRANRSDTMLLEECGGWVFSTAWIIRKHEPQPDENGNLW